MNVLQSWRIIICFKIIAIHKESAIICIVVLSLRLCDETLIVFDLLFDDVIRDVEKEIHNVRLLLLQALQNRKQHEEGD